MPSNKNQALKKASGAENKYLPAKHIVAIASKNNAKAQENLKKKMEVAREQTIELRGQSQYLEAVLEEDPERLATAEIEMRVSDQQKKRQDAVEDVLGAIEKANKAEAVLQKKLKWSKK